MIDRLFALPGITIAAAARELNVTYPAAKKNVEKLVAAGILTELATGRNRVYMAREIIDLLEGP
jgi:DNA-binding MarR family transcriptional regulator